MHSRLLIRFVACAAAGFLLIPSPAMATSLELSPDAAASSQERFATEEIRREAVAKDMTLGADANATRISIAVAEDVKAELQSYQIRVNNEGGRRVITVRGADATGVMYGGLDIAEAIRNGSLDTLNDAGRNPHIAKRGIKFNIPLDLRTPSYTDPSDSGQAYIPEVWKMVKTYPLLAGMGITAGEDMPTANVRCIRDWRKQLLDGTLMVHKTPIGDKARQPQGRRQTWRL